jgi:hypothetical protein
MVNNKRKFPPTHTHISPTKNYLNYNKNQQMAWNKEEKYSVIHLPQNLHTHTPKKQYLYTILTLNINRLFVQMRSHLYINHP